MSSLFCDYRQTRRIEGRSAVKRNWGNVGDIRAVFIGFQEYLYVQQQAA